MQVTKVLNQVILQLPVEVATNEDDRELEDRYLH